QLLDTQYRMHNVIMGFSNEQFYHGQLKADISVAEKQLPSNDFAPIEFIDTAGCCYEEYKNLENGGITNEGEIKVLENILTEYNPDKYSMRISTPYRANLNEIESVLSSANSYANTVDKFLGQERDVIIIS